MAQFATSLFHFKKEHAEEAPERTFLGFAVGDQSYALDVAAVREILRIPRIYSLPKVPVFVKGLVDLRGEILPLMDLKERLGLGGVDTKKGRIVVMLPGAKPLGLLVDAVLEVFRVKADDIKPSPEMPASENLEFLEGIVKVGENLYMLLKARDLLTPQELKALVRQPWAPGR
jgi:purine-binding chemotaxis protein CheW